MSEKKKTDQEKIEEYLEKAIKNIESDRGDASLLLHKLLIELSNNVHLTKDYGPVAAKYLEVLQKSNEQLVKISYLLKKQQKEEFEEGEKEKFFEEAESKAKEEKSSEKKKA